MDLQSGYHQVEIEEQDREKTAFITPDGLYQFRVYPFGLKSAPSQFQRTMDLVLGGLRWTACLVYLDDVLVFGKDLQEHLERLELVLIALREANLKLKLKKCLFVEIELKVLGHVVNAEGIRPDPEKVRAVMEFKPPSTGVTKNEGIKLVQSFLGMVGYFRRHLPDFSVIAKPLSDLTRKNQAFVWGESQEKAFEALKASLTECALLTHPRYELPFEIHTDACGYGVGATLIQKIDGLERPLCFVSRLLNAAEKNYSISEQECLALVWALKKFRTFVWGCKIICVTDHQALCWLLSKKDLAGRLARWSLALQEYDIEIKYKSGKLHVGPDCLSRYPLQETEYEEHCPLLMMYEWDPIKSEKKLAEWQREDKVFGPIIKVLQMEGTCGNYFVRNEVLFLKVVSGDVIRDRLCVPRKSRYSMMRTVHAEPTGGHLGYRRTMHRAIRRYYWPKMAQDVAMFIRSCESCQARKGTIPAKPAGKLQSIYSERPIEKMGVDLLGPFPQTEKGNKYVIVAVCYFTKWCETKAIPTGKTEEVVDFIVNQVFVRHGAPKTMITDRGKCFVAELAKGVTKALSINHKTTSSYNPQANGQCERMNHTLAMMLSMFISSDQKDWDISLPLVTMAYNTAVQESTGYTPFYLMYGREAILPSDIALGTDPNGEFCVGEDKLSYVDRLQKTMSEAKGWVRLRMDAVKKRQKEMYDNGRREVSYKEGDLVLIYRPIRKVGKSDKLLHRWLGPFQVIREITPVNYEVILRGRLGKSKPDVVHVYRMKRYHEWIETDDLPYFPGDDPIEGGEEEKVSATNHPTEVEVPEEKENKIEASATEPPPETVVVRRSTRTKKPSSRFPLCLLMSFIMTLMTNPAAEAGRIITREGTIFKEETSVAFSESTWLIATNISLSFGDDLLGHLRKWLERQVEATRAGWPSGGRDDEATRFQAHVNRYVKGKVKLLQKRLDVLTYRIMSMKSIGEPVEGPNRHKRGLVDMGGQAFKWLFGLTTEKDFLALKQRVNGLELKNKETLHVMERQVSLINESLWETRNTVNLLSTLSEKSDRLEKVVMQFFQTYKLDSLRSEEHLTLILQISLTFDEFEDALSWLAQEVSNLEIGLVTLTLGRLPPEIFSPSRLAGVVGKIMEKLPRGWTCGSDLWDIYNEARITTAVIEDTLQLFISPACSGRTAEWIFPPSAGEQIDQIGDQMRDPPSLPLQVEMSRKTDYGSKVIPIPQSGSGEMRHLLAEVLTKNTIALDQAGYSTAEIHRLIEIQSAEESTPYPYEWIAVSFILTIFICIPVKYGWNLKKRVDQLESRLSEHIGPLEMSGNIMLTGSGSTLGEPIALPVVQVRTA
jgi:hypothetical protein